MESFVIFQMTCSLFTVKSKSLYVLLIKGHYDILVVIHSLYQIATLIIIVYLFPSIECLLCRLQQGQYMKPLPSIK